MNQQQYFSVAVGVCGKRVGGGREVWTTLDRAKYENQMNQHRQECGSHISVLMLGCMGREGEEGGGREGGVDCTE